ncbi:MAG: PAS domain S-box protein [Sediminibacterium sp.]
MEYHILHIEDSKTDADLVKRVLQRAGLEFSYQLACDKDEVIEALDLFQPNIILCDHSLPSFNSKMAFSICKEKNIDLPFILVTGSVSEEFAVDMLKVGVDDYLLKSNLQRLPVAIENAFEKRQNEKKLQIFRSELNKSETHLRSIFENSSNALLLINKDYTVIEFNGLMANISAFALGSSYGKNDNILELLPQEEREKLKNNVEKIFSGEQVCYESVYEVGGGPTMTFLVNMNPVNDIEGEIEGVCISITDITKQKTSEKVIRESEEKYRNLVEQASDAIIVFSFDGIIYEFNKTSYTMLGYTKEEYAKLDLTDILVDNIIVSEDNYKAILAGETKILNRTLMHKNGSLLEIEVIVKMLTDEKAIAFARDVTERKKAEQERKDLTNRLLLATTSAGMGLWDWDFKNNHLFWDEALYQLYNIDSGHLGSVYEGWLRRVHPDDKSRVDEVIKMAITNKKKEFQSEFRIIWDDLSVHYLKGTGIIEYDEEENIKRLIGINWDISEQKEKERHLKLLESVITHTTDSVLITEAEPYDEPGPRIMYVNDAFTKMTGYSSEEVMGKTPRILQGLNSDKLELNRLSQAIRKGQACEITTINYKKSGEEFWVNLSVSPVANENGWYTHWIAIEKDVTAQKLAEIHLKELNGNLRKQAKDLALSNSELEQFAFVASHDLQEPLRMITSFLTLLEKKYGNVIDDNGKKYIGFAVNGAKRMQQIILDLLELSRVGRMDVNKEELDLNEMLNGIKRLFRKRIEDQKAVITIDPMPKLYCHLMLLHQVFQNLIDNALMYSNIECQPLIKISVIQFEDHWQFSVIDNGIGIRKEYFDKIFIIFQRLHNRETYSGTGMGLAITKKIIERLGGKIWIESEEGKGSAFYFTIPKTPYYVKEENPNSLKTGM